MKRLGTIAGVMTILAAGIMNMSALPISNPTYQDIDTFGDGIHGVWIGKGASVSGKFNIKTSGGDSWTVPSGFSSAMTGMTFTDTAGFVPGTSPEIEFAQAYFFIAGVDSGEVVSIDLANNLLGSPGFPGGPMVGIQSFVLFGGELEVSLLYALNQYGELDYTIRNDSPSESYFAVKAALLQVPDGGTTLMLLGSALTALGLIRRRIA